MKNSGKIIGIALVVALVGGGAAAGIINMRNSSKVEAIVVPVSSMTDPYTLMYDSSSTTLEGTLVTNVMQVIKTDKDFVIDKIYVTKGDAVNVGDPLVTFDTTILEMQLNIANLTLESYNRDLSKAQARLYSLQNGGPIEEDTSTTSETITTTTTTTSSSSSGDDIPDSDVQTGTVTDEMASAISSGEALNNAYLAAALRTPIKAALINVSDVTVEDGSIQTESDVQISADQNQDAAASDAAVDITEDIVTDITEDIAPQGAAEDIIIEPAPEDIIVEEAQTDAQTDSEPAFVIDGEDVIPVVPADSACRFTLDDASLPAGGSGQESDPYVYTCGFTYDALVSEGDRSVVIKRGFLEKLLAGVEGTEDIWFRLDFVVEGEDSQGNITIDAQPRYFLLSARDIYDMYVDETEEVIDLEKELCTFSYADAYTEVLTQTSPYLTGTGTSSDPYVYICDYANGNAAVGLTPSFVNYMIGYGASVEDYNVDDAGNHIARWFTIEFHDDPENIPSDELERKTASRGYCMINGNVYDASVYDDGNQIIYPISAQGTARYTIPYFVDTIRSSDAYEYDLTVDENDIDNKIVNINTYTNIYGDVFYKVLDYYSSYYSGSGTQEDPYVFLCYYDSEDPELSVKVMGSFWNRLMGYNADGSEKIGDPLYAVLEFHKDNLIEDPANRKKSCVGYFLLDGTLFTNPFPQDYIMEYKFSNAQVYEEETEEEADVGDDLDGWEEDTTEETTSMTREEAIKAQEQKISSLKISIEEKEIEISKLEKKVNLKQINSRLDGIVSDVADVTGNSFSGTLMKIQSKDGFYVQGTIGELSKDSVEVGTEIKCADWYGNSFMAEIIDISDYPTDDTSGMFSFSYGSNPNESKYQFSAEIKDSSDLELESDSYLTITLPDAATNTDEIIIDRGFVRTEGGSSYVLKDVNGILTKQYVLLGETKGSGSYVVIRKGLSSGDKLAFPYGDTAVEGAVTREGTLSEIQ